MAISRARDFFDQRDPKDQSVDQVIAVLRSGHHPGGITLPKEPALGGLSRQSVLLLLGRVVQGGPASATHVPTQVSLVHHPFNADASSLASVATYPTAFHQIRKLLSVPIEVLRLELRYMLGVATKCVDHESRDRHKHCDWDCSDQTRSDNAYGSVPRCGYLHG